jgi:hypothetical protein
MRTIHVPAALALAALALGACADQPTTLLEPELLPQFAATTFKDNVKIDFFFTPFVPCADGGAGELVELSGPLHMLFHVTEDANGGIHVKSHVQPQGISGVGMSTGTKYQGTGVLT